MDKILYQDTVPYEAPSTLSTLIGPVSGTLGAPSTCQLPCIGARPAASTSRTPDNAGWPTARSSAKEHPPIRKHC